MLKDRIVVRIVAMERLSSSVNGNPRFRFAFDDGTIRVSMSDASYCYAVGNPGMRVGDLVALELTRAGRVSHMSGVES